MSPSLVQLSISELFKPIAISGTQQSSIVTNNMSSKRNNKKRSPVPTSASTKKAAATKSTKPSPDSVAYIDLTNNSWEDSVMDFEKERKFGAIRRELEPPSARKGKRGGPKMTGLGNSEHHEIVILDSDDEDDIFIASE